MTNAAHAAGVFELDPTVVMVDVGARSTKIVLVVEGGAEHREPEVDDAGTVLLVDHDVGRLQVTVDDTQRVRGLERRAEVASVAGDRLRRLPPG